MSGVQFVPMGIPTFDRTRLQIALKFFPAGEYTPHKTRRKPGIYRYVSYFLLEKNPYLSEVHSYVFDSTLEDHFTRGNSLVLMRSCGKEVYKVD